ncbi:putative ABC-type ATPase [Mucilaginibacter dorajii]|nr:putative ABC-type ATPase [Mucilaginibacter dorajii]
MITGSNGAGKSTVGPDYLPQHIGANHVVFDGDKLYTGKVSELWPVQMRSLKEAKKIAAEFIITTLESLLDNALQNNEDFVYEGHFPSYATWDFPKRFKDNGYQLQMLFLGLKDADLSEMRVGLRAKKGGHNVPRYDIENNFYGNLEMLNEHFHLLDHLQIVDTSVFLPKPLAAFRGTELISSIRKKELPEWFTQHLPRLAERISK